MKTRTFTAEELAERLELALDGAHLGFWDWNLKDNSVHYDRHWFEMLGLDPNHFEMKRSTWEERVHPNDFAQYQEDLKNYLEGKTQHFENTHRLKRADGHWVFILERGRIVERDENGNPTRFIGTHFDVTPIEKAKHTLQQQNHLLKQLVEEMPVSIAMMDKRMCYITCSKKWLVDHDLVGKEVIGKSHYTLFPKVPERWRAIHKRALGGSIEKNHRDSFVNADGKTVWLNWSCTSWYDIDGTMGGILMLSEDITDMVAKDEKINQDTKMIALGLLSSGLSQEIQNPLSEIEESISTLMANLPKGSSASKDQMILELDRITQNSVKIESIVGEFSSLTQDGTNDPFVKCNISSLINQVSDLFQVRMKNDGVLLKVNNLDKDIYVSGQSRQLLQVIVNLVANALDAAKGNLHAWVKIDASVVHEHIRIVVSDSGPGIAQTIENKIFTPFFTTKEPGKGIGLGLSISQTIAEKHGGYIKLERSLGPSTFVFELPLTNSKSSTGTAA